MKALILLITLTQIAIARLMAADGAHPLSFDLAENIRNAELIVVCKLTRIDPPDEMSPKDYYRIEPKEAIKGKVPQGAVVSIHAGRDSTEGTAPAIEPDLEYLLFLTPEPKKQKFPEYSIMGVWRGLVSLDKLAQEQRSTEGLGAMLRIDIHAKRASFMATVKKAADRSAPATLTKESEELYNQIEHAGRVPEFTPPPSSTPTPHPSARRP
jgi:hypothetical protein